MIKELTIKSRPNAYVLYVARRMGVDASGWECSASDFHAEGWSARPLRLKSIKKYIMVFKVNTNFDQVF